MYATYEFYEKEYYGDSVSESSFEKWESRAEDKLRYICGENLNDETRLEFANQIAKATCALVDLIFQIDVATKNANDPKYGNVKSMSSGGESVSFGNNDTLITAVLSDKKAQARLMFDTVAEYLSGTGLLYMGV